MCDCEEEAAAETLGPAAAACIALACVVKHCQHSTCRPTLPQMAGCTSISLYRIPAIAITRLHVEVSLPAPSSPALLFGVVAFARRC